jgi:hypothetical protein
MDTDKMLEIVERHRKRPKSFSPERVMENPEELHYRIVEYFSLLGEGAHPTPPGLALAMGLNGFNALVRIINEAEIDPKAYPEESLNVLHVARSMLEDYYLDHGLREAIPAQFTKFIMSSFFNRNEKTIQEGGAGGTSVTNNTVFVSILGISRPYEIEDAPPELLARGLNLGRDTRPGFDGKVIDVDNSFNLPPGTTAPPVRLLGVEGNADEAKNEDFETFMGRL